MKRFIFLSLFCFLLVSCTSTRDGFVVTGHISGTKPQGQDGFVKFTSMFDQDAPVCDTVEVKNGHFVYRGKVTKPTKYTLNILGLKGGFQFVLENDDINITIVDTLLRTSRVSGGRSNELLNELNSLRDRILPISAFKALTSEYKDASAGRKAEIDSIIGSAQSRLTEYQYQQCIENPDTYYALEYIENHRFDRNFPQDKYFYLIEKCAEYPRNHEYALFEEIYSWYQKEARLFPGMQLPNYKTKDVFGEELDLHSIARNHKLTVVEIWFTKKQSAAETRAEMREFYKKVAPYDIALVSVNVDPIKNFKISHQLKKMNLPWPNAYEMGQWESAIVEMYNVSRLPSFIVIDSSAKIIARNIRYEQVNEIISNYIK